jgi:hypothetical protein
MGDLVGVCFTVGTVAMEVSFQSGEETSMEAGVGDNLAEVDSGGFLRNC